MKKGLQTGFVLLVASCWLLAIGMSGCQNQGLYRNSQLMMGTVIEVISSDKQAADIVFTEIYNWNV